MSRLEIIGRAFDRRAHEYDESRMHRQVADTVAAFADLAEVEDVLDVATGTGLVLRALRARRPHLALTGTDLSAGMLAVAREALPDVDLLQGDAALLPLPDDSVDLVTCVTALHIIPDVTAALAEWRRVMRPRGRAVTATFAETGGVAADDAHEISRTRPYPRTHLPFRSIAALGETASLHGFTITRHLLWSDGTDTVLIAEWAVHS